MLNRIFVIIGVLVICAIAAAFVVPRFIQWGDYRPRLQAMATEAFGTEVAIEGDIHLTLLPQPQLEFTGVRIGPKAAPAMSVAKVEAEFSLFDFLRDQYHVTSLTLDHPVVNLAIGPDGTFAPGVKIAQTNQSNVSIADADVVEGTVQVADARTGKTYSAQHVEGQLKLEALDGPFTFQGAANVADIGYGVRVSTGKVAGDGTVPLSFFLRAMDDSFSLESNGALQPGAAPKYKADITYRFPPPKPKKGEPVDVARGDFVLTGKVEATSERVLLTEYLALPDENRATTRLTGAGEISLGKDIAFNAVVSGGVVALPPRDATTELTDPPYELVRLLGETPLPPIPPIPGKIGMDITELNLRAVSLRDLTLDAVTDGKSWSISSAGASLPGGAKLGLTGKLNVVDGKPVFAGNLKLATERLDLLAQLYRKPAPNNPLFNVAGSLGVDVGLAGETLTLSNGTLVVAGINQGFNATIGFGQSRSLLLQAHFTTLGEAESGAIGALLPDITGNGSFGATFPKGQIELSASKAVLFGLDGTDLAASASWEGGVLQFSRLSATDLGGAAFDVKATAFGTVAKPELSGSGSLHIEDGAPIVATVLATVNTPPAVADFLRRSLPADVKLQLDAPAGDGGQTLNVEGTLGTAETKLQAKLGAGIINALSAPIAATIDLKSATPHLMMAQLGLSGAQLFDDRTPLHLSASIDGVPSNSYVTHVALEGGEDRIVFNGNVVPGDFTKISGEGPLEVKLADPSALAAAFGASGLYLPALAAKANLLFSGLDDIALSEIDAGSISGDLKLSRHEQTAQFTGALTVPELDIRALLPAVAGASSTVTWDGLWPDGPIDIGAGPRTSEGRIDVKVASLTSGDALLIKDATFGYDWDAESVHLRNLTGSFAGGTASLDASVCCSNTLSTKDIAGRITLTGASLDALAPGPIAAALDGSIDAAVQFQGNGETPAKLVATLSGSGSYTINGFSAAHFDPALFAGLATLNGVADMPPEALTQTVTDKLQAAPFVAPSATGSFTIAGGVVRSPNLAIVGTDARIFGGATLRLADLTLDARYSMSPTTPPDPTSALDTTTAEVAAVVQGPLWAPRTSFDVAALVDGMTIKAKEIELALLEQRRAEADARAKAQVKLDLLTAAGKTAAGSPAKQTTLDLAAAKAAEELAAKRAADAKAAQDAAIRDLGI